LNDEEFQRFSLTTERLPERDELEGVDAGAVDGEAPVEVGGRGAEMIEAPQDRPWGARAAYLKGPGGLTVEIEQVLKRA
jgi:hypothetical protein